MHSARPRFWDYEVHFTSWCKGSRLELRRLATSEDTCSMQNACVEYARSVTCPGILQISSPSTCVGGSLTERWQAQQISQSFVEHTEQSNIRTLSAVVQGLLATHNHYEIYLPSALELLLTLHQPEEWRELLLHWILQSVLAAVTE